MKHAVQPVRCTAVTRVPANRLSPLEGARVKRAVEPLRLVADRRGPANDLWPLEGLA